MTGILDELVLQLDLESKDFRTGELAVVAGLDRLTEMMEQVAAKFDDDGKKAASSLDKTGKKATKTGKEMEAAGKKAASFFSSVRTQVLALAGVSLSLAGLKGFVTSFTGKLNEMVTQADAFGMSAKSLDGWITAGKAFGVSAAEITGAFSRINDAKARLASGLGLDPQLQMLMRAAGQAGVNIDITHDSTEEVMRKLAQVFPKLTKAQQQAYGSALGMGYADQQWMASGHATRDVDDATANSGYTTEGVAGAQRVREQWAKLDQTADKLGITLEVELLPYVVRFNDWLQSIADWAAKHPDEIKAKVDAFLKTVENIAGKADAAAQAVGGWQNAILLLVGASVGGKFLGFLSLFSTRLGGISGMLALIVASSAWNKFSEAEEKAKTQGKSTGQYLVGEAGRRQAEYENSGNTITDRLIRWWDNLNTGVALPLSPQQQAAQEAIRHAQFPAMGNDPAQHAQSARKPGAKGAALLGWLSGDFARDEAKYGLPAGLLRAVATTESGGDPFAVSGAGAKGLFQFMDGTARGLGLKGNDVFDPQKSADAAAKYLSQLLRMFHGDLGKALSAYNWGAGNVMKKGLGAAPRETRDYVPRVLASLPRPGAQLSSQHRGGPAGSTVTQSTHIGTLNVTTSASNVSGITDDAHRKISRTSLAMNYASGVSG